jgi:hypothetical protein
MPRASLAELQATVHILIGGHNYKVLSYNSKSPMM